ncbi:hypothetical protein D3P07_08650 [Paenibacillus sp. 1011MAR3C5]|uniref:hypothetical protein n=1 Tax=Paenibacillus sp. 1011MAR3C5 TaxID=1675787 RepID=UPI000E6D5104|nr:hypothetical protein [Paenibacillus sp. 1011MAR3C5]RJE90265.1 hypothetical protein D3P07_08650 [Paenibacillus sp. 1011MAR3C5]
MAFCVLVGSDNYQSIYQSISADQIQGVQMSKAVYTDKDAGASVHFERLELGEEEVGKLVEWINSVPDSDITEVQSFTGSIKAAITLTITPAKTIRIQYVKDHIYIERTDTRYYPVKYMIKHSELKDFFDDYLKGFYFGKYSVDA